VLTGRVAVEAKPLSEGGASPPLSRFRDDQVSAHQVTTVDGVAEPAVTSPSRNAPHRLA
jgi:hypothetical protein